MLDLPILESRALKNNPLGDPHVRTLPVYLPPGYADDPARRYPLILMLSSHGNTGLSLIKWRPWDEALPQQLDRLINSGACPPFLMAIPDTWTRLGGSPHVNSPAIGNYGDYLLQDVIPYVETHYRTLSQRGVMGRSSGGYGALVLAMTHPGTFAAVADHSGDAYFEFCYLPQIAALATNLARFGGMDGYMAETLKIGAKPQAFFDVASALAFAATFAPNPAAPYGFDLPINVETGALLEDVWARCVQGDPLRLVSQYVDSLRNLKELFIDCGIYDEYNLQVGARLLSQRLHALNVPHTYDEYPGGHRGTHYRYDVSLPRLVAALID